MSQFKNPKVQKAFDLYEAGEITKAEYLQELKKINQDPKYKYVSQFYHQAKQSDNSKQRPDNTDMFVE